ncbi:hypothetical protein SAMN04488529_101737 [Clostridium gasigenes]|uniref:HTH cro/C1-type domain-containing protein n=1 Tax=Clostridium gasigenes TaxID=94869 RepID=A0A1H0N8P0_9CLOT|nr:hypothetical protein SAMN04488529_101737 [Clostridium gasigenes]
MLHSCPPSTCRLSQSATIKEVFQCVNFKIIDSLYSNLPETTIGQKIRKLRLIYELTQLEFAKSIHRGFGTITKWEQELTFPNKDSISYIISIYNLDENYFNFKK